jgi:hypothetical protein
MTDASPAGAGPLQTPGAGGCGVIRVAAARMTVYTDVRCRLGRRRRPWTGSAESRAGRTLGPVREEAHVGRMEEGMGGLHLDARCSQCRDSRRGRRGTAARRADAAAPFVRRGVSTGMGTVHRVMACTDMDRMRCRRIFGAAACVIVVMTDNRALKRLKLMPVYGEPASRARDRKRRLKRQRQGDQPEQDQSSERTHSERRAASSRPRTAKTAAHFTPCHHSKVNGMVFRLEARRFRSGASRSGSQDFADQQAS